MSQRKEKYARNMENQSKKLENRVLNLEAAVYDDLLPYKMACMQRERREAHMAQKRREDTEWVAKEIARHDRDMMSRFVSIAIALVLVTAMLCTVIPMVR